MPTSILELFQVLFPLWAGLISLGLVQVLNVIVMSISQRKLGLHYFFSTGGMPSSHSAMVTGLTTGLGLTSGWTSPEICVSAIFSFVVLYDAAGIRRAAGNHAAILNRLIDNHINQKEFEGEKLRELLGHTRNEVFVGVGFGILIAFLLYYLFYI